MKKKHERAQPDSSNISLARELICDLISEKYRNILTVIPSTMDLLSFNRRSKKYYTRMCEKIKARVTCFVTRRFTTRFSSIRNTT